MGFVFSFHLKENDDSQALRKLALSISERSILFFFISILPGFSLSLCLLEFVLFCIYENRCEWPQTTYFGIRQLGPKDLSFHIRAIFCQNLYWTLNVIFPNQNQVGTWKFSCTRNHPKKSFIFSFLQNEPNVKKYVGWSHSGMEIHLLWILRNEHRVA